jgi:hypothetical protein
MKVARDPQAWLADILARMLDYPAKRIGDPYRGTGTQNGVLPPDTSRWNRDGESVGLPATHYS